MRKQQLEDAVLLSEEAMFAWYGALMDAYLDQDIPIPEDQTTEIPWEELDNGRLKISHVLPNGSELTVFVAPTDWQYNT